MKNIIKYLTLVLSFLFSFAAFSQEEVVAPAVEEVVKTIPDYNSNFNLFLVLLLLTLVLLIGITIVAGSIKSVLASEKNKPKNNASKDDNNSILTTLLIGFFIVIGNQALAMSFSPDNTDNNMPWLLIENTDLYLLIALNIVLLFVLLYLKNIFNECIRNARQVEETKEVKSGILSNIGKLFNDAVPIEEEESIIMDHDFDGIKELDNDMPRWWVMSFFATVIFAFVYIFHYHVFKTGDLQTAGYEKEMALAEEETKAYLSKMSMNVDETNATVMTKAEDLEAGKALYTTNCVMCHKDKGQGDIGPNLTDEFWLYTGDIKAIYGTIKKGTSAGMPEHASKLNPIQIQQVASFVWSLPFTAGKEPQGEKYTKEPTK